jgi:KDO2-lipid IV(A) lauroyltransferase
MYYLLYGFLYVVSLLPFWILYAISDVAYVIIYYFIGYRKEVVMGNLEIAFPEKSLDEKKLIAKKFYKNFADSFVEVIKLVSISPVQLHKRFSWDHENLNKYYATDRNVQAHLGHFFNWEYANLSLSLQAKFKVLVVYMPIANKAMDKIFIKLRTRFNAKMIGATSFLKDFKPYSKERTCLIFVADQNAGQYNLAYWLPFFGKLAPFVTGPEKTARLNNSICVYAKFTKLTRGCYHVSIHEIITEPRQLEEGGLTKRIRDLLEENIREQPENYLWSHRRWKREYDPSKHRAL